MEFLEKRQKWKTHIGHANVVLASMYSRRTLFVEGEPSVRLARLYERDRGLGVGGTLRAFGVVSRVSPIKKSSNSKMTLILSV